ncbi:MAG: N-acetylmuramoyl-L-alanine amidase [Alkaliphilus sp.]|nr:N-acetylmuramoyl-L-alanine amidase [Alkaliphilus transvaalensis]PHS28561.1 MAG: N-acetylmuramoyl-L-alanine amidase [Alkaliphilus sp.]
MSNISGYKIFIDPGHGGGDSGAQSGDKKHSEKTFVLDMSKHLRDRLEAYGVQTMMSRESDVGLTLRERTEQSNNYAAHIFVSMHCNAGGGTGIETWIHDNSSGFAQQLAQKVQASMISKLKVRDRGVKKAPSGRTAGNIFVVDPRNVNAWSILPEVLFMDHTDDITKLKSPTFLKDAAYAIADGIIGFINTLPLMG